MSGEPVCTSIAATPLHTAIMFLAFYNALAVATETSKNRTAEEEVKAAPVGKVRSARLHRYRQVQGLAPCPS